MYTVHGKLACGKCTVQTTEFSIIHSNHVISSIELIQSLVLVEFAVFLVPLPEGDLLGNDFCIEISNHMI